MRALLMAFAISAAAKAPVLDALWPGGAQQGTSLEVLAVGKQESWPVGGWCSEPGIEIEPLADSGMLLLRIAADAKPGPCLLRLHNAEGASPLRSFVVSTAAEIAEVEPNNELRTPQTLASLPVVVNARLQKSGDTDFFAVELAAGARLVVRLDGYGLGSPIDPFLHLYGPDGAEIAIASDSHNRDPILIHQVAQPGRHVLQVVAIDHKASTNVRYAGSDKCVYRLAVETSDWARYAKPEGGGVGRLETPGAEGEHGLVMKKGERLLVQVQAATLRLPTDPVLRVLTPDGKLLKEVDDANKTADPEYLISATTDGEYKALVRDRFGRGGPDFWYRLEAAPPQPSCRIVASAEQLSVKAGESAELKLKLERLHGHDLPLAIEALRLPLGLRLEVPEIPAKTGDFSIKLVADADAPAASGELHLQLREGESLRPIAYSFLNDESRGDFLVNETQSLWLTVLAP